MLRTVRSAGWPALSALLLAAGCQVAGDAPAPAQPELDAAQAERFAALALGAVVREYPSKPMHVHIEPASAQRPSALHPSFYGSYDWHSAVHGHWLLVRLLRLHPQAGFAAEARAVLETHLAPERIAVERAYFEVPANRSFERAYGWAWLLTLAAELHAWRDDADAQRWRAQLRPLEEILVARAREYLPRLTYPIRTGVHPDSGFALALMLDYARTVGDADFAALIERRARDWYAQDRAWSFAFEPSGEDFFSSGLNEADLMRRVLTPPEFSAWLDGFWPGLAHGELGGVGQPAQVSDLTDGRIVHLVGLNLSRAWTMRGIAAALPAADARRTLLLTAAARHADAGLAYVFSGHYEGEHWLASFAVHLLTQAPD
jgi:hypothetical protein